MASEPSRLILIIQPAARLDLLEIWDRNAETYGADHADRYVAFLTERTERLATDHSWGRLLPGRPGLLYVALRKGRGHGHLVFYRVTETTVEILRYQHTAQDWHGRASRGEI